MSTPRLLAFPSLLLMLLLLPGLAFAADKPLAKDSNPTSGKALGFSVATLAEPSNELNSRDLYGEKPVLIAYWATWCGPCLMEIPALNTMFAEYGDEIQFVGISIDTAKTPDDLTAMVKRTMKTRKIAYPVGIDTNGVLAKRFKLDAIPLLYGIDLDGNPHIKIGLGSDADLRLFVEALRPKKSP